ncbi:hypothetical protein [Roseibium aggregatum]|uniref:Uncharacterized protein n=1 Tax=Roseibium aggregatum TaxID=187304 RepID=A0A926S5R3_9HYPH|nr:hypothetical protein [Roseibium aggregatum]MBD1547748.1 hypothetical protein [Roseibium aggregatum]
MTPATISICDIDEVVRREADEAQKKTEDTWYWGPVGNQQAHAVHCAVAIIKQHLDENGMVALDPCLEALRRQRQSFMDGSYDTDGYAAATVWAILQPLEACASGTAGSGKTRLGRLLQRRKARQILSSAPWAG